MPFSRAAFDSEPARSICSSSEIFPGPTALSGPKSIRKRMIGCFMLHRSERRKLCGYWLSAVHQTMVVLDEGLAAHRDGVRYAKRSARQSQALQRENVSGCEPRRIAELTPKAG